MKFKTLMGIRNNIVSSIFEIDTLLEELNLEVKEMKDEAQTCWIAEDPKYKGRYEFNRKRAADLEKKKAELNFFLEEIDNAELK